MNARGRRGLLSGALLALLAGCTSVQWQDSAPRETWRGAHLRRGAVASVSAGGESAAASVYLEYEAVYAAMREIGATLPSPPLLLAVDVADELLLGDAKATIEGVAGWHRQHVSAGAGPRADPDRAGVAERYGAPDPAVPDEVLVPLARALAGAVAIDSAVLGLPAAWREGMSWGMVVPTGACTDAAADALLDHGLAHADLSFGERLMLVPLMPFVRSKVRGKLHAEVQKRLLEAALATARREGTVPANAMVRGMHELGIDDDESFDPQGLVPGGIPGAGLD
ncbi:MAG TPA: hypothetical protein VFZ65_09110 [Planctomycetota bacterium]|nr:hypothetical protein [Planctomycetota bacterium]